MTQLMAHRRASLKKIRVDKRREIHNVRVRSELKTVARKVKEALTRKKVDEVEKEARNYFAKLDKAVKKGVIHENRASRLKSRTSLKINVLKKSS
jgi:small subunit ribosomal protein S20